MFFVVGIVENETDMAIFGIISMLIFLVPDIIIFSKQSQTTNKRDSFHEQTKEMSGMNTLQLLYEVLFKRNEYLKKREFEEMQYNQKVNAFAVTIDDMRNQVNSLKKELNDLQKEILCEHIITSDYDNLNSEECKNELAMLRNKIAELVKSDKIFSVQTVTNSKKQLNDNKKQILRCFTAECSNVIDNLTFKNVDTARNKITRAFENINKIFVSDSVSLNNNILELKLKELSLVYAVLEKKEQEREEQKAIREQMLEEEKVRREIEREKAKIEKEESQFRNEVSKLMGYMQKATDIEKQLYVDKIRELEEKLKLLEKDKENVLQREQNTRAGFVYIISNIGSFGENIYKIGMTRRLEPMDRVKELGDASVPFEFDVHAMIFSEDAPGLETTLHNTFRGREVNKVNLRKEFYKVSLDEIEKVVKENYNATVTFTKVAEALQYRQSLKVANEVK